MSDGEVETTRAAREAAVRVPERRQITMVVQCPGDLVPAQDPVRMVMALVETLDLSRFAEPIKARDGVTGRDATLRNCWWVMVVRVYSRDRFGAGFVSGHRLAMP
jgi:hypothetical protein